MNNVRTLLTFLICLLISQHSYAQLVVEEPGFQIINTFAIPGDLTSELGTMMFSADGGTIFVIDDSEGTGSAVMTASVVRDADGNVTSFGPFTEVFQYDYMDTGLEYGPGTDTFFFKIYNDEIGQRLSNGTVETTTVTGYDGEYGGLAFIPPTYPNGGNLVTAEYENYYSLWLHQVTPDGDGSFTVNGEGALFASFEDAGEYYVGDLIFITDGPLAGNVMVTLYQGANTLVYFPLGADGLPVGGVDVTPSVFASGYTGAWGVAIDPITNNIWMIDYSETEGIALIQIGGLEAIPVPFLNEYSLAALALLLLLSAGWLGLRRGFA